MNYAVNAMKDRRTVLLRQGKGRGNSQSIFALSAVGRCAINAEMSMTLEMYSTLATMMFMCSTTGSLQSSYPSRNFTSSRNFYHDELGTIIEKTSTTFRAFNIPMTLSFTDPSALTKFNVIRSRSEESDLSIPTKSFTYRT